jgi:hypothetical protein
MIVFVGMMANATTDSSMLEQMLCLLVTGASARHLSKTILTASGTVTRLALRLRVTGVIPCVQSPSLTSRNALCLMQPCSSPFVPKTAAQLLL